MTSSRVSIQDFLARSLRVGRNYAWIVRDHLLRQKREVVAILALSALAALSQGSTIAVVGFTVSFLEQGTSVGVPVLDRILERPMHALVLSGVFLAGIVLLGGWASYVSMARTRAMARSFHERCAARALAAFSEHTSLSHPAMPASLGEFRRLIVRDSNQLGKALENGVRGVEPVLRLTVAGGILFWIDLKLSLFMAPLLLLLLPLVYRIGARVQRDSKSFFERAIVGMGEELGRIVGQLNKDSMKAERQEPSVGDLYLSNPSIRSYFDEYDRIQLAQQRAQFSLSMVSSVFLLTALLTAGYLVTQGEMSWGMMLAYVIALLQVVNASRTALASVTSLSMFYPAITRYLAFVIEPTNTPSGTGEFLEWIELESDGTLSEGEKTLVLEPGRPTYYLVDQPLDRVHLASSLRALWRCGSAPRSFFEGEASFMASSNGQAPAEQTAETSELVEAGDAYPESVDSVMESAPSPGGSWESSQISAFSDDSRRFLLIDAALWAGASPEAREGLLSKPGGRYLLLVSNDPAALDGDLADSVVVARDGRIVGIGSVSWIAETEEQFASWQWGEAELTDEAEIAG